MTSNNKAKRKRTKKSGVFKRLEQRELKRDIEALIYAAEPLFSESFKFKKINIDYTLIV